MSHSGARDLQNQNPMVSSMVHLGPAAGSALPVPASLDLQLGPGSPVRGGEQSRSQGSVLALDTFCSEGIEPHLQTDPKEEVMEQ